MRWSNPSALSGLTLILLSVFVIGVLLYGLISKGSRRRPALATVVVGAVGFQVFHFIEHGLQVGYWLLHPKQKPWLTPWAQTGADGLAYWCQLWPGSGRASQRGAEFLHLVGNSVFQPEPIRQRVVMIFDYGTTKINIAFLRLPQDLTLAPQELIDDHEKYVLLVRDWPACPLTRYRGRTTSAVPSEVLENG